MDVRIGIDEYGVVNNVTCKICRYHKQLREGTGMLAFVHCKGVEKKILTGELNHSEALRMIHFGGEVKSGAVYLCPTCKELMNHEAMYLMDNVTISPYGTVRYDIKFLYDSPICPTCGGELKFIKNVRSSNVKCPKCEGELKSRVAGYFD